MLDVFRQNKKVKRAAVAGNWTQDIWLVIALPLSYNNYTTTSGNSLHVVYR